MTLMEHNLAPSVTVRLAHRVQVQWTAMRHIVEGARPGAFHRATAILVVEVLDEYRAMVELWVEENGRRRTIHDRTLIKAQSTIAHSLLQIDAGELCRITIKCGSGVNSDADGRLLYAQCSLLANAGFEAGAFDPPTATLADIANAAAASA